MVMRKIQENIPYTVSGLPELMFDAGFTKYKIYCAKLGSPFAQIFYRYNGDIQYAIYNEQVN